MDKLEIRLLVAVLLILAWLGWHYFFSAWIHRMARSFWDSHAEVSSLQVVRYAVLQAVVADLPLIVSAGVLLEFRLVWIALLFLVAIMIRSGFLSTEYLMTLNVEYQADLSLVDGGPYFDQYKKSSDPFSFQTFAGLYGCFVFAVVLAPLSILSYRIVSTGSLLST